MSGITEFALRFLSEEGSITLHRTRQLMSMAFDPMTDAVNVKLAEELLYFWKSTRQLFDADANALMEEFLVAYESDTATRPTAPTSPPPPAGGSSGSISWSTASEAGHSSGSTQRTCTACGGSGMMTCSSCGGMGYHSVTGSRVSYDGSVEYYEDRHSCACSAGRTTCYSCGGSGSTWG